jgi:hypothetical protein
VEGPTLDHRAAVLGRTEDFGEAVGLRNFVEQRRDKPVRVVALAPGFAGGGRFAQARSEKVEDATPSRQIADSARAV